MPRPKRKPVIRTVYQLFKKLRLNKTQLKPYDNGSRAFQDAIINCTPAVGRQIGFSLFDCASTRDYPGLPAFERSSWGAGVEIIAREVGELFRIKENRIKYWPLVRKRLKAMGVKALY
jgi:hypothetical protein